MIPAINRNWHINHLGHLEYARDMARAEADAARIRNDWRSRREYIITAWRMRKAIRELKTELEASQ